MRRSIAVASLALLGLAGCQIAPALSPDDTAPNWTRAAHGDFQKVGDCLYATVEHFWHFGPVRHVDDVTKTDLPGIGEIRIEESAPVYAQVQRGWQIRVRRMPSGEAEVALYEGPTGIFGGPSTFYNEMLPQFIGDCSK